MRSWLKGALYASVLAAVAATTFVACQSTDSLSPVAPTQQSATVSAITTGATKVDVCHYDDEGIPRIINVAESAYQSHLDHGDTAVGPEVCDGIDNDCDGAADEDACQRYEIHRWFQSQQVLASETCAEASTCTVSADLNGPCVVDTSGRPAGYPGLISCSAPTHPCFFHSCPIEVEPDGLSCTCRNTIEPCDPGDWTVELEGSCLVEGGPYETATVFVMTVFQDCEDSTTCLLDKVAACPQFAPNGAPGVLDETLSDHYRRLGEGPPAQVPALLVNESCHAPRHPCFFRACPNSPSGDSCTCRNTIEPCDPGDWTVAAETVCAYR